MKTTKEQRDKFRSGLNGLHFKPEEESIREMFNVLCDDADEAERLEKENAELLDLKEMYRDEVMELHTKIKSLADDEAVFGDHNIVPSLRAEIEQLRAKLDEAYERAAELAYAYALDNGLRDHARRLENEILDLKEKP